MTFPWPGTNDTRSQETKYYFSLSYQAYNVPKDKLVLESAVAWTSILALIFVLDILVKIVSKFTN